MKKKILVLLLCTLTLTACSKSEINPEDLAVGNMPHAIERIEERKEEKESIPSKEVSVEQDEFVSPGYTLIDGIEVKHNDYNGIDTYNCVNIDGSRYVTTTDEWYAYITKDYPEFDVQSGIIKLFGADLSTEYQPEYENYYAETSLGAHTKKDIYEDFKYTFISFEYKGKDYHFNVNDVDGTLDTNLEPMDIKYKGRTAYHIPKADVSGSYEFDPWFIYDSEAGIIRLHDVISADNNVVYINDQKFSASELYSDQLSYYGNPSKIWAVLNPINGRYVDASGEMYWFDKNGCSLSIQFDLKEDNTPYLPFMHCWDICIDLR